MHEVRLPFIPFRLIRCNASSKRLLTGLMLQITARFRYKLRFVKYTVIILLCGTGIGGAVYRYLPTWVFWLFVLVNFMGWAIAYGSSRHTGHDEDEPQVL